MDDITESEGYGYAIEHLENIGVIFNKKDLSSPVCAIHTNKTWYEVVILLENSWSWFFYYFKAPKLLKITKMKNNKINYVFELKDNK